MGHTHSVTDMDVYFEIDAITRKIQAKSGKSSLIQGDHNSERFTFRLPRMIDGHDMAQCNRVQIHFINVDSATKAQSKDVYEVEDMRVDAESEEFIVLSWLISKDATKYAGSLSFLIKFECVNDGTVNYAWNTSIYTGVTISGGIDNNETAAVASNVIARGSTPTHSFNIPFDTSTISGVRIIYAQNGEEVFQKKSADCMITDYDISVTLTQSETLKLKAGSCQVQMVVYCYEQSFVSNIIELSVADILSEDVVKWTT